MKFKTCIIVIILYILSMYGFRILLYICYTNQTAKISKKSPSLKLKDMKIKSGGLWLCSFSKKKIAKILPKPWSQVAVGWRFLFQMVPIWSSIKGDEEERRMTWVEHWRSLNYNAHSALKSIFLLRVLFARC